MVHLDSCALIAPIYCVRYAVLRAKAGPNPTCPACRVTTALDGTQQAALREHSDGAGRSNDGRAASDVD